MSIHEVSWDDASVAANANNANANRKVERFVAKQGLTTRVSILTERPIRTFTHYKRGYGYFSCPKADGLSCVACESGDRMGEKFATNILVYPLNAAPGVPLDASKLTVLLWQPGPKVFADLRAIKQEWGPLQQYDVKVTCTNEQYQHLNITPCRESLWLQDPSSEIIASFIETNSYDLVKLVGGRKETPEEVTRIWTTSVTREAMKQERSKNEPTPMGAVVGSIATPAPSSPTPQLPDFANLLRSRTA